MTHLEKFSDIAGKAWNATRWIGLASFVGLGLLSVATPQVQAQEGTPQKLSPTSSQEFQQAILQKNISNQQELPDTTQKVTLESSHQGGVATNTDGLIKDAIRPGLSEGKSAIDETLILTTASQETKGTPIDAPAILSTAEEKKSELPPLVTGQELSAEKLRESDPEGGIADSTAEDLPEFNPGGNSSQEGSDLPAFNISDTRESTADDLPEFIIGNKEQLKGTFFAPEEWATAMNFGATGARIIFMNPENGQLSPSQQQSLADKGYSFGDTDSSTPHKQLLDGSTDSTQAQPSSVFTKDVYVSSRITPRQAARMLAGLQAELGDEIDPKIAQQIADAQANPTGDKVRQTLESTLVQNSMNTTKKVLFDKIKKANPNFEQQVRALADNFEAATDDDAKNQALLDGAQFLMDTILLDEKNFPYESYTEGNGSEVLSSLHDQPSGVNCVTRAYIASSFFDTYFGIQGKFVSIGTNSTSLAWHLVYQYRDFTGRWVSVDSATTQVLNSDGSNYKYGSIGSYTEEGDFLPGDFTAKEVSQGTVTEAYTQNTKMSLIDRYLRNDQHDKAMSIVQTMDTDNISVKHVLANIYMSTGKYTTAQGYLYDVNDFWGGKRADIAYLLARSYMGTGDNNQAQHYFNQVLSLPDEGDIFRKYAQKYLQIIQNKTGYQLFGDNSLSKGGLAFAVGVVD